MKKKTQKPKRTDAGDKIYIKGYPRDTPYSKVISDTLTAFTNKGTGYKKITGWLTAKDKQDIRRIVREEIKKTGKLKLTSLVNKSERVISKRTRPSI